MREGDLIGERICEAAHERGARVVLLPTIPYGVDCNLMAFPLAIHVSQATLDAMVSAYRAALSASYPGSSGITYAGKAFMCAALAQWADRNDLWGDFTGVGELKIAELAGMSRNHILVHGVNKSAADLAAAVEAVPNK